MTGSAQISKGLLPALQWLKPAAILFLCLMILGCNAQPSKSPDSTMQTYHVARVIENKDADHTEVTFLESARFYRLLKSNKHYTESLALLKEGAKNNTVLRVLFTTPNGEVIEKVETLPPLKK